MPGLQEADQHEPISRSSSGRCAAGLVLPLKPIKRQIAEAANREIIQHGPASYLVFGVWGKLSGCLSKILKAGFLYSFFISAPQQHLGFGAASVEALTTSTSQRQVEAYDD